LKDAQNKTKKRENRRTKRKVNANKDKKENDLAFRLAQRSDLTVSESPTPIEDEDSEVFYKKK
jgi:hypothetical protein